MCFLFIHVDLRNLPFVVAGVPLTPYGCGTSRPFRITEDVMDAMDFDLPNH